MKPQKLVFFFFPYIDGLLVWHTNGMDIENLSTLGGQEQRKKENRQLASACHIIKAERYEWLWSLFVTIIHTKKQKSNLFHIHSLSKTHRALRRGAFVHWNLCNSAQNGLQTCWLYVPLHGTYPLSISQTPFWFLFFGFSFFLVLEFRAPIKSWVEVKKILPIVLQVCDSFSLCVEKVFVGVVASSNFDVKFDFLFWFLFIWPKWGFSFYWIVHLSYVGVLIKSVAFWV